MHTYNRYHNEEYGFPLTTDSELFARLVLEINQAGLSWTTILKKKDNFFQAYDNFDIAKVFRWQCNIKYSSFHILTVEMFS